MSKYIKIVVLATLLLTACAQESDMRQEDQPVATDTIPMLVMQIQKCARLYTTEYHIHKIVTHEDVLKLKGNLRKQDIDITLPLGERKVAIPMDATLKAYIDCSSVRYRSS